RHLRGDLDAILLRALQKEPDKRYRSVAEFGDDVRRHLEGKPIVARGNKLGYRIRTALAHDWRVQIASVAIVLCTLVLSSVSLFHFYSGGWTASQSANVGPGAERTSIAV